MLPRIPIALAVAVVILMIALSSTLAPACCPAPPSGKPVVNADQTVIMIWDPVTKTQHFIRQASFKSEADDFGFIIPTPSQPELEESGNEAFPLLAKITEPEIQKVPRPRGGSGCGCSSRSLPLPTAEVAKNDVTVLAEKLVAGFHSVVLEAERADALVTWLKEHGYAFSPEIQEWAKPYIKAKWKFTALKVAKGKEQKSESVSASSLRLTFKTDQPLFPYREPDPKNNAAALNAHERLLRIYFLADGRYRGELTKESAWTGKAAWADKISAEQRSRLLAALKLPDSTGPKDMWLTEFEDNWPYRAAPGDVSFVLEEKQHPLHRPPIIQYVSTARPPDGSVYALAAILFVPPLWRKIRRKTNSCPTP
jgi:Uncharacterized protein conserved in bacteria (DUF2330)